MGISNPPREVDDRLRWFVGSLNRIVVDAADTGGSFGLMEQWAPAGFSPPAHVHSREDSAVIVVAGEMTVRRGDDEIVVSAGESVLLPRGVPHTFLVTSDDAHFYEIVSPAGFEQYHIDASDPAPVADFPPAGPPDIERLVAALAPYGAQIVGPPMG